LASAILAHKVPVCELHIVSDFDVLKKPLKSQSGGAGRASRLLTKSILLEISVARARAATPQMDFWGGIFLGISLGPGALGQRPLGRRAQLWGAW